MDCETCRELISASIDDELSPLERQAMRAHVARCPGCVAVGRQMLDLDRTMNEVARPAPPDLSDAILARDDIERRSRRLSSQVQLVRLALFAVGTVQLLLSLDQLLHESSFASHLTRDLGGWDLAFAIGLLVCAVHPWRARGMLPMVVALVGVITITLVVDVRRDAVGLVTELPHLAEYTGLVLLWLLARMWPRRSGSLPDGDDEPGPGRGATLQALDAVRA